MSQTNNHAARLRELTQQELDMAKLFTPMYGSGLIAACKADAAALLAAARLTVPEEIGEKHRDGNWWMVWAPDYEQWFKCRWMMGSWRISGTVSDRLYGTPTHALPMLPAPEAPDATPR